MQANTLQLTNTAKNALRDSLKSKFTSNQGVVLFRRIDTVIPEGDPKVYKFFCNGEHTQVTEWTNTDLQKDHVILHKSFWCVTYNQNIREEPKSTFRRKIRLPSDNHYDVNILRDDVFVKEPSQAPTPNKNDLAFIFISYNSIRKAGGNGNLIADKWGLVSEQFLRFSNLIKCDWCKAFDEVVPKTTPVEERETILRQKLISGKNRIATSTWMKWSQTITDYEGVIDEVDSVKRFFLIKTERNSSAFTDVYLALVLMARYGEIPCPANVIKNPTPDANGKICYKRSWNIPRHFMAEVFSNGQKVSDILEKSCDFSVFTDLEKAYASKSFKSIQVLDNLRQTLLPISEEVTYSVDALKKEFNFRLNFDVKAITSIEEDEW